MHDKTPSPSKGQSQTFKYIGVYNNEMGILSRKTVLKEREQGGFLNIRNEARQEMKDYLVNRYMMPKRLRTVRRKQ